MLIIVTADAALAHPVTIGSLVLAAITAIGAVAREVVRARKHARNNAAQERVSEREAAAAEAAAEAAVRVAEIEAAPGLLEKIEQLWEKRDECEEGRRKDRQDAEERERKAAEECKRETARQVREAEARVRADLGIVAARVRDSLDADSTGVHQLERIVRKSPTPPEPMPVHPDPHSALSGRREIPPPRRGKETDR